MPHGTGHFQAPYGAYTGSCHAMGHYAPIQLKCHCAAWPKSNGGCPLLQATTFTLQRLIGVQRSKEARKDLIRPLLYVEAVGAALDSCRATHIQALQCMTVLNRLILGRALSAGGFNESAVNNMTAAGVWCSQLPDSLSASLQRIKSAASSALWTAYLLPHRGRPASALTLQKGRTAPYAQLQTASEVVCGGVFRDWMTGPAA